MFRRRKSVIVAVASGLSGRYDLPEFEPDQAHTIGESPMAKALLFLAGPDARRTTGYVLPVDGGLAAASLR